MWLTILDYREAEVIAKELNDDMVMDVDEYVHNMMGHSDYYYMSNDSLVIKIDEKDNPNLEVITKLKQ